VSFAGEGDGDGLIYSSTNSGVSWFTNNAPSEEWSSVASSADGSKLVAVANNGPIYSSTNSGVSWQTNNVPSEDWISVASSADGDKLVALVNGGGIYTFQSVPTPKLNLTTPNSNLAFSWLVPSMNFILQQNSDFSTTNWVTLTNTPTLNFTNLQNQLIMSPSNSSGYFRLISQ